MKTRSPKSALKIKIGAAFSLAFLFLTPGLQTIKAQSNTFPASGNVGVGTTSPIYSLDVNGGINGFRAKAATVSSNDAIATFENATGIQAIVRGNGNVGIGTASPGLKLEAKGAAGLPATSGTTQTGIARMSQTTGVGVVDFGFGGDAGFGWIQATSSSNLATTFGLLLNPNGGNVGIGTTSPANKLHVAGSITVDGNINAKYQDVAEWVPATHALSPGTVVTLDPTKSNHVEASSQAYDTRVAGVISTQPGIALGERGENKVLVATTGRVRVKVDASHGPIQVGDLLVTSDIPGLAMKSQPINVGGVQIHRPGTLIGKALEPLAKGRGEILVLLSLQ